VHECWLPVEEFAASSVTFAFHADKAATA
jgi:hypothetical protein